MTTLIWMIEFSFDDFMLSVNAGQIELYSHISVIRSFVDQLKRWDFNVCAVYMTDSQVSRQCISVFLA